MVEKTVVEGRWRLRRLPVLRVAVGFHAEGTEEEHRDHREEQCGPRECNDTCLREAGATGALLEAVRGYVIAFDSDSGVVSMEISGSEIRGNGFLFARQQ